MVDRCDNTSIDQLYAIFVGIIMDKTNTSHIALSRWAVKSLIPLTETLLNHPTEKLLKCAVRCMSVWTSSLDVWKMMCKTLGTEKFATILSILLVPREDDLHLRYCYDILSQVFKMCLTSMLPENELQQLFSELGLFSLFKALAEYTLKLKELDVSQNEAYWFSVINCLMPVADAFTTENCHDCYDIFIQLYTQCMKQCLAFSSNSFTREHYLQIMTEERKCNERRNYRKSAPRISDMLIEKEVKELLSPVVKYKKGSNFELKLFHSILFIAQIIFSSLRQITEQQDLSTVEDAFTCLLKCNIRMTAFEFWNKLSGVGSSIYGRRLLCRLLDYGMPHWFYTFRQTKDLVIRFFFHRIPVITQLEFVQDYEQKVLDITSRRKICQDIRMSSMITDVHKESSAHKCFYPKCGKQNFEQKQDSTKNVRIRHLEQDSLFQAVDKKMKLGQQYHNVLRQCSGCCLVRYCSTTCQKADWNEHKAYCKMTKALYNDKTNCSK